VRGDMNDALPSIDPYMRFKSDGEMDETDTSDDAGVDAADPEASDEPADDDEGVDATDPEASDEPADDDAGVDATDPEASDEPAADDEGVDATDPEASDEPADDDAGVDAADPEASDEPADDDEGVDATDPEASDEPPAAADDDDDEDDIFDNASTGATGTDEDQSDDSDDDDDDDATLFRAAKDEGESDSAVAYTADGEEHDMASADAVKAGEKARESEIERLEGVVQGLVPLRIVRSTLCIADTTRERGHMSVAQCALDNSSKKYEMNEREARVFMSLFQKYCVPSLRKGFSVLVFNETQDHARAVAEMLSNVTFDKRHVNAIFCGSDLNGDQKEARLRKFKDGTIDVICTCTMLQQGYDNSNVQCIVLNTVNKNSTTRFIQRVGRGLRPQKEKDHCLLLDISGNSYRMLERMLDDDEIRNSRYVKIEVDAELDKLSALPSGILSDEDVGDRNGQVKRKGEDSQHGDSDEETRSKKKLKTSVEVSSDCEVDTVAVAAEGKERDRRMERRDNFSSQRQGGNLFTDSTRARENSESERRLSESYVPGQIRSATKAVEVTDENANGDSSVKIPTRAADPLWNITSHEHPDFLD